MKTATRIAGLYAIADTQYLDDARLLPAVGEAIAGGARIVNTDKNMSPRPYAQAG
jgi:hypothetical protein